MNSVVDILIPFFLGVLSGAVAIYALLKYRKHVLKTKPASVLTIIERPDDLNEMLFQVKLPPISDQVSLGVVYSHKYAGLHEIGFCCEKPISMPIPAPMRVRVSARWRWLDGNLIVEKEELIGLDKPWYADSSSNGFSLLHYDVPELMPVDKRISLDIAIDNCGNVADAYGAISIYGRNVQTP